MEEMRRVGMQMAKFAERKIKISEIHGGHGVQSKSTKMNEG